MRQTEDPQGRIKVSVLMITYNHEQFISQAIESILMQQVDFPYEVVVGEDCSKDATRAVLLEYQARHPDKIRLILPEKNLGVARNFYGTLAQCRGEYVAVLEGDDFWTSPQKLQRQVDFLSGHPDFSICFHRAEHVDSGGRMFELSSSCERDVTLTMDDLLRSNPITTCTVMFRNDPARKIPDWCYGLALADWPLHVFNATRGRVAFMGDVMAAYRMHAGGVWSSQDQLRRIDESVKLLHHLDDHLGGRYHGRITRTISGMCYRALKECQKLGYDKEARSYALECFRANPWQSKLYRRLVASAVEGLVSRLGRAVGFAGRGEGR